MKLKTKLLIFLAAVFISFVGFYLIASPLADMIVIGKKSQYQMISNYMAQADAQAKLNAST